MSNVNINLKDINLEEYEKTDLYQLKDRIDIELEHRNRLEYNTAVSNFHKALDELVDKFGYAPACWYDDNDETEEFTWNEIANKFEWEKSLE